MTLAEVCAKQCHKPTLDPLSILANVCEGSQVLQTTDARAESIGNNEYGNSSVQNIRSKELELEKLKKKELRVDNIIADEHKLKFFAGFTNLNLSNIFIDFITDHQLYENDRAELSLQHQFLIVLM